MKGEPLQGYKHWFDPAVEKAGVRDFTWYCLRHSFASRLIMKGVDLTHSAGAYGSQKHPDDLSLRTSCSGAQTG
jgi:hypothetical protein